MTDFLTTLDSASFDESYVASIRHITAYSSATVGTSVPEHGEDSHRSDDAMSLLSQLKQSANLWPNSVEPLCESLPVSIVNWNPELQTDLETLKGYASQPTPYSETVRTGIVDAATSTLSIVTQSSGRVAELSRQLDQTQTQWTDADAELQSFLHSLNADMRSDSARISQLHGRLHHLESKTSPDKSAIAQVKSQIERLTKDAQGASAWRTAFRHLDTRLEQALPSLSFLRGFWDEFSDDLAHVIQTLRTVQQDPDHVTSLTLQEAEDGWNEVYRRMQAVADDLRA